MTRWRVRIPALGCLAMVVAGVAVLIAHAEPATVHGCFITAFLWSICWWVAYEQVKQGSDA